MGYGDEMLKKAPETTIREAIATWTKIREDGKQHRQTDVVKTANRMLDKYEGELKRRHDETVDTALRERLRGAGLL